MKSLNFLALFMASLSVGTNGQLFANIVEGDSLTVQQCGKVGIEFGGGYPPYSFYVWSYYALTFTSGARMDSSGKTTWSIREAPSSVLYLYLEDSLGTYVVSHYFEVLPGTTDCGSSAEFERADEEPVSTITSPSPTQIPASTLTAPPSTTTTGTPSLDDCISKKASCAFTATFLLNTHGSRLGLQSTGSAYPQETQIGAAFDNCDSTVNVTQHFSGSVTITDNWSVESYDYVVPPQARAALVGTASFDAIFGKMNMKYSNYIANLNNVVYFKSDANQNPVVALRMFSCNESFPAWNATAAVPSGDGPMGRYTPRCLVISTLVLLALLI
ncbi:hypothetical protein B0H19DRAFT_1076611 [Mycena capillaripes]|nr:hypothetical protein B0H19DRAFT_1076611 [Mycena capillaripes]